MTQWKKKKGYDTFSLAEEDTLDQKGTQIQLARFYTEKYGHYHKKTTEFYYVLKGEGKAIVDDKEIKLTSGTSLLIRPNEHHTFINEREDTLEVIMFKTNSEPNDTFTE